MLHETTVSGTNATIDSLPVETVEEIDSLEIVEGETVFGDYTITIHPDPDFPQLYSMFIEAFADTPDVEPVGGLWEIPTLEQAIETARDTMKQEFAELWHGLSKG